ncbi:TonB-dependent receptor [Luteimonas sp. RC10]|uniref:TonB-dependent receptor plug domain-containing protein n=1 Tax=Luteimonas sp. RC10 TaxID=2587035 RepID=UPI0016220FC1|nr:TonB-dependent receptor [Luteimonas sp. RC10]MBB3344027.1 outer membrane receptor protein involved in Fe transport [Luteimonas sp. RC10]
MPVTPRHLRSSRCPLALALLAAIAMPAAAQSTDTRVNTLDQVQVTGSRIARTEVEGPAPVTVITAEDIQKQGFSTVWESLGTLTQFTGNTLNESDQTGNAPNGQFMNLRGLGPGYQLILLNGQRLADYPQPYGSNGTAVSLGSIPAAAIERIEVMSGGASAIYGSDAVAGVVNIITKENFSGDTIRLRGGTTSGGGGDSGLFQWTGGRTGDRWSLTYALERLDREEIVASQRDLTYLAHPQYRTNPERPTASISGVYFRAGQTYLWRDDAGTLSPSYPAMLEACEATNPNFVPFHSASSVAVPNRCGALDYYNARSIQNAYGKTSGYLSGSFDFSDTLTGYVQLLGSDSNDKSSSQTHYYIGEGPFTVQDPTRGLVTAQRIFLPEEVGGTKYIEYDERAWSINAGLRGTLGDGRFDWDASVTSSRFEITTTRPRFLTRAVRDHYMGPVLGHTADGTEIREFYTDRLFAPGSAALYDQLTTTVVSSGVSKSDQAQFVFSGPLFDLPAGPLQMAAVVEAAKQSYSLTPDPRTTVDYTGPDRVYNLTSTPGGGPRNRYAAGLELRVPVFSSLEATLAGRYDKYDDITSVDDAITWQAGLEWRPFKTLLLRGAHATSFRAPDLLWVYAGTTGSNPFVDDEYLCRLNGIAAETPECTAAYNYQTYMTQSSNPLLEEEKGKSTTLGVVWDALPNLSLSVDWYRIELEGRVQALSNSYYLEQEANCRLGRDRNGNAVDTGSQSCQFYAGAVERVVSDLNPDGRITRFATYPINAALMRTEGLDASLRYGLDLGNWGDLNLQAGYTHVLEFEVAQFGDEAPRDVRSTVEYNSQRSRANWRAAWSNADWNASLYGYRYGSRPNYNGTAIPGRTSAYVIWNADVSHAITDNVTLGVSVLNLLDEMPPRDDSHTAWPYFASAYSAIGRQVFANITFDF